MRETDAFTYATTEEKIQAENMADCAVKLLHQIKSALPQGIREIEFEELDENNAHRFTWTISHKVTPNLSAKAEVKRVVSNLDPDIPTVVSLSLFEKGGKFNMPQLVHREGVLPLPFTEKLQKLSEKLVDESLIALSKYQVSDTNAL